MTVSVVREIEGVLGDAKRREGLSVLELLELFPDDYHAEAWLCWVRWEGDIRCVDCGSGNFALSSHKKMRFRCRGCGGFFSVKKGTVMESSKLGLQKRGSGYLCRGYEPQGHIQPQAGM